MGIESIHESYVKSRRLTVLADHFAQLFPDGSTVLDVGSGDGGLAAAIIARKPTLQFKGLDTLVLPESEWQPTRLREAMFVKKTGSFCCSACGSHPVAAMREKADGKWRAFVDAVGGVPRVDRRCLLLGAKLMAVAVGGSPDAVAGVRHLCAAPIWDLAPTSNAAPGEANLLGL